MDAAMTKGWALVALAVATAATAAGCGGSDASSGGGGEDGGAAGATGGAATSGGTAPGTGGARASGGADATGGAGGSGGASTTGGAGGSAGGSDAGGTGGGGASGAGGTGGGPGGTGGQPPLGTDACDLSDLAEPSGRTLRVSPTGTDTGDCSEPCRTLQYAADQAEAESLVLVADGVYAGFRVVDRAALTFRADGDSVIVRGDEAVWGRAGIDVESSNEIRIEGFIVEDSSGEGIRVVGDDVVLLGNEVRNNGNRGILTGFARRVRIVNNITHGNLGEHGIYVSNSDGPNDAPVICGNVSYDNAVNGIQLNGDCFAGGDGTLDQALIANNVVHDNGAKGLSIISAPGVSIVNNVIYDNHQSGAGAGGIHLVNEPGCDDATQSSSNGIVANNTVIEPNMAAIRCNLGATGNRIFNNILVGTTDFAGADEVGGNLFSTTNVEADTVSGLLLDAGALYAPLANSPAIDQGEATYSGAAAPSADFAGNPRPAGAGFDVGAHEVP